METFLLAITAIATVIGTLGGLYLQHRGNKHFEEQNQIMIAQGSKQKIQVTPYRPPKWPLVAMGLLVLVCWAAALFGYFTKPTADLTSKEEWKTPRNLMPFNSRHFHDEIVDLDGKAFEDCTFMNVTFFFHGRRPFVLRHNRIEGNQFVRTDNGALSYWTDLLRGMNMLNPDLPPIEQVGDPISNPITQ